MLRRSSGGDQTWRHLRDWIGGQKRSERMAALILKQEGYSEVDPSHPLGGPDRGKDAIAIRNGKRWVMAVYFPREPKEFREIQEKFKSDMEGAKANNAHGIAFVTNQELTLGQRDTIRQDAGELEVDLFHLERVASILNAPRCYGIRLEFLDIEMTKEEQLAFFHSEQMQTTQKLESLITGGDSFCYFMVYNFDMNKNSGIPTFIKLGSYPLYDVSVRVTELFFYGGDKLEISNYPERRFAIGNINLPAVYYNQPFLLNDSKRNRFNVFINARNGTITQFLDLVRYENWWYVATQVIRNNKVVHEYTEEKYLEAVGKPDWIE